MRESLKNYAKYFLGVAILVYAVLSVILKDKSILDNLDLSITITLVLTGVYSGWLWKYNPLEKTPKIHPHSKPIELQKRLIVATTEEGDYVLDPCSGGYSVLEACQSLNREFIGCDIETEE